MERYIVEMKFTNGLYGDIATDRNILKLIPVSIRGSHLMISSTHYCVNPLDIERLEVRKGGRLLGYAFHMNKTATNSK